MIDIDTIIQVCGILLAAPLVAGVIKKCKAALQNRRGPSLWQMYRDLRKLWGKGMVFSPTVSWVFHSAPYISIAVSLTAALCIPVWATEPGYHGDFWLLIYIMALGRFFLVLSSLDAGSTFGGMGGSRDMYVSVLIEPALLLALLSAAFTAQSTNLAVMAASTASLPLSISQTFAAAAFFLVLLAETGRIPVDNPDTHLELTMIHEGMLLEYSGRYLALLTWAAAVKQLVLILIMVKLFLPLWLPFDGAGAMLADTVLKVLVVSGSLALAETLMNKMRLFKLPGFLGLSGFLSLLALAAQ